MLFRSDANVIVHEYGHVLSNSALPGGNAGMERKSLEEGICDYLAGSYSKEMNDWEWERLFKWDGWNEFWAGRNLLSTKHYPENLVGQIHRDGEIFSSALMNIELLIGRAETYTILLSTMPTLVPNLTMPQAALLFLETDSMLFGGQHSVAITAAFDSKGIAPGNIIVSNSDLKANENEWIRQIGKDEFEFQNSSQKWLELEVIDQKGRVVQQISKAQIADNRFKTKALTSGVYLIRAVSEKDAAQFRFIVLPE